MNDTGAGPDLPDGHILTPYADQLDTHAGHIDAYGSVLGDADPDKVHGVMLVMYSADGVETLPTVSVDVDPRYASLWMLGSHIHHVTQSAQGAGGDATMEAVAQDAIQYVRRHGIGGDPQR